MILLSVIIPIYNAGKYLRQTLDTILAEKIELEIICVNDCSTDNSIDILNEYSKKYSNIVILTNEHNLFAGRSRNIGLDIARGKYIHFLDADDYVVTGSYKKIVDILVEKDLDFIKTSAVCVNSNSNKIIQNSYYNLTNIPAKYDEIPINFSDNANLLLSGLSVVPWNACYSRDFLLNNNIKFNDLYCVNDRSFFIQCCIKSERMSIAHIPLVTHRANVDNSLISKRKDHFECHFKSYNIIKEICKNSNIDRSLEFMILDNEIYDIFSWLLFFISKDKNNMYLKNEVKKFLESDVDVEYFRNYHIQSKWVLYLQILDNDSVKIPLKILFLKTIYSIKRIGIKMTLRKIMYKFIGVLNG